MIDYTLYLCRQKQINETLHNYYGLFYTTVLKFEYVYNMFSLRIEKKETKKAFNFKHTLSKYFVEERF